jgi:S1/P1 Nuclease.
MDADDRFAELAGKLKDGVSIKADRAPQGTVETWAVQWATDSLKVSAAKAYPCLIIRGERFEQKEKNGAMVEAFAGFKTTRPRDYDETKRLVVREQLAKGGLCLAKLLEALFQ